MSFEPYHVSGRLSGYPSTTLEDATVDKLTHTPPTPDTESGFGELPVRGVAAPERADAARNRTQVLAAAERLFAERGVENVSMDEVAEAAGVGKGTVYRRFGDRASLASAVLDATQRRFQEGFLRGPPPLGPGAPPAARLKAFGLGTLDQLERHGEVALAAESGRACARLLTSVHLAHRAHVEILLHEALPDADYAYLADVVLEALSAEMFRYFRYVREMPLEQIKAGFTDLVDRLLH